jgi:hypothetical protein
MQGSLEQSERVLDGVDQGPVEVEQLLQLGAPREKDCGHASAVGCLLQLLGCSSARS